MYVIWCCLGQRYGRPLYVRIIVLKTRNHFFGPYLFACRVACVVYCVCLFKRYSDLKVINIHNLLFFRPFLPQTTPSYQPQVTQAFRPVPPPGQGQGPIYKPPSPAQPRVVSQSPSNQYPGLITTLRKEAPITQAPSPIFSSQPAAAINRGE